MFFWVIRVPPDRPKLPLFRYDLDPQVVLCMFVQDLVKWSIDNIYIMICYQHQNISNRNNYTATTLQEENQGHNCQL